MKAVELTNLLKENTYPGRGIALGVTPNGKQAVMVYFIMGRSANSRNRVFDPIEGGIRTMAADPAKLEDPSLIIYNPVRTLGNDHIVTNGDQTDTIYEHIQQGKTFEDALRTRTFEPDGPNWTPRISGLLHWEKDSASYKLSILKSADGNGDSARRYFFEYPQPVAGEGHFIHTYQKDENPLPSFEGEPRKISIPENIEDFSNAIWANLNADNKVSLFIRTVDLATGETEDTIYNGYDAVCQE